MTRLKILQQVVANELNLPAQTHSCLILIQDLSLVPYVVINFIISLKLRSLSLVLRFQKPPTLSRLSAHSF